MALMYDRIEKQDEITIVYKYQAAWYIFLLAFLAATPFTQGYETPMMIFIIVVAAIQIGGKIKPNSEIRHAMKDGKVQISGSRFSFSNPVTFVIKK